MATVEGIKAVMAKLTSLGTLAKKANVSARVGYSASYAIFVHENLEAHHPNGGQAKFLEQPARQYQKQIAQVVRDEYKRTKDMAKALLLGGLYLQRLSQELCPVATGYLRASADTRLEQK